MATVYHGSGFSLCDHCGSGETFEEMNTDGDTLSKDEHTSGCIGDTCDACGAFLVDEGQDAVWREAADVADEDIHWFICASCNYHYPSTQSEAPSCSNCLKGPMELKVEDER